jgi:hypothetical protein
MRVGQMAAWAVLFLSMALSACDPIQEIRDFFWLDAARKGPPAGADLLEPEPSEKVAFKGGLARENRELLAEMIRVVFDREDSEDLADYEPLVQTLNQGASLEGVYRGIIMGSRYRALESGSQAAAPSVLKLFATEMAEVQEGMREPTRFDPERARQVPRIDYPEDVSPDATPKETVLAPPSSPGGRIADKSANYRGLLKIFVGASPFTLKRVLCEEALRKFEEAGGDPSAIPLWYAGLAVRLSRSHLDFGLEQRSSQDFEFHKNFAQRIAIDRVKWEVLNRYHRYLNAAIRSSG